MPPLFNAVGNAVSALGNLISGGSAEQQGPFSDDYGRVRGPRDAPGDPRGSQRKQSNLERLHEEIAGRCQRRLNQIANLQAEQEQLLSTQANWQNSLQETSQKQNTVNQDLDASRTSASGDEDIALRDVLSLFTTVNDMIEGISTEFRQKCKHLLLPAAVIQEIGQTSQFPHINLFIELIQRNYKKDARADVIIGPLVRHILCVRLIDNVFTPFFPGMEQSLSDFFTRMRQVIEKKDGLDRANRWRSLTTGQLDDPPDGFAEGIANTIIEDIKAIHYAQEVVEALNPDTNLAGAILSLVETATRSQQKAKAKCIEGEVNIYMVDHGAKYNDILMTPVEIHPKARYYPSGCLLTVGVGMEANEVVTEPDGSLSSTNFIYKAADTLCMNWLLVR